MARTALILLVTSLVCSGFGQSPDSFNPGADRWIHSLAVQSDGKILVGGDFTVLGGQPCSYIARLNEDGSLDTGFNPGVGGSGYGSVDSLVLQADGKIVVGGWFTAIRTNIGRLHADGTPDTSFDADGRYTVNSLALQADGGILVGGQLRPLVGEVWSGIRRLHADGSLDIDFSSGAGALVFSLAVQPDGRILVGGEFPTPTWQTNYNLCQFNADATLDTSFNVAANFRIRPVVVQPDGKILLGGDFTMLGGQPRTCIGRLNADGSLDSGFSPAVGGSGYHYPSVNSLALQADGKILVGGRFTTLGGQACTNIGRLNPDGSLDSTFNPGANGSIVALALQPDGKVLVGGDFTTLCGQPRNSVGRLNNTGPAIQDLSYDGSTLRWQRGGTSPEIWRAIFELTTNATDWINLGAGARVPGGWELSDVSLPIGGTVRARGFATGGHDNASSSLLETCWGPPAMLSEPPSRTNYAGTATAFNVMVVGSEPMQFQWFKDAVALSNSAAVDGAQTANLSLSGVFKADEGVYTLVVSNAYASVTSPVARLTVVDPWIVSEPTSQTAEAKGVAAFRVVAAGTPPLRYQWFKEGLPLALGTNAILTLTNLNESDAGHYAVVVTSPAGSVSSRLVELSVNLAPTDLDFNPAADQVVAAIALQADGKVLVGGAFTMLGGQSRSSIGRLNADGTLDITFKPEAAGSGFDYSSRVNSLAVQADGKILVAGLFTELGGQPCSNIGRLNADGTLDTSFNPAVGGSEFPSVTSLAIQTDGKILVGGYFTEISGQIRNSLGRLNADGSLDTGFNPGVGGSGNTSVNSLVLQADGKILVGGWFTMLGGQPCTNIGRLNVDGSADVTFGPAADQTVSSVAVQADGKIVVGGWFTMLGGHLRYSIGRLNADGTLDDSFNPGVGGGVSSLALQADGKILVGGYFTELSGQMRNSIGRLNVDGSLDTTFNQGAEGWDPEYPSSVYSLALQADGKIVLGGDFSTLGGQPRNCIGRINSTGPATQHLSYEGSALLWYRGGTTPEVWRTTFDVSTDGTNWSYIGSGVRLRGLGWECPAMDFPASGIVRVRGFLTGGEHNGSSWYVESMLNLGDTPLPVILVESGRFGLTNGGAFDFYVQAQAGQTVAVEASANLLDWIALKTNSSGATPVYFSDPAATNYPQRFYRARLVP